MSIRQDTRRLHARIHSAGHLLDAAMHNCGFDFPPTKVNACGGACSHQCQARSKTPNLTPTFPPRQGYHFADAPSVEYLGNIAADQREAARAALEDECNRSDVDTV